MSMLSEAPTNVLVQRVPFSSQQREWYQQASEVVDLDRMTQLIVDLTNIPSPPGYERPIAEFLAAHLSALGLEGAYQPLDEHAGNAVGRLRGTGEGPNVLLYAPTDTIIAADPVEDIPWVGRRLTPQLTPRAITRDGYVIGLGANNPKGMIAVIVTAVDALRRAGVPLKGDAVLGFGASGMPVIAPPNEPRRDIGLGVGARHMIHRGVTGDFAMVCKPGWAAAWEEVGLCWFKVTVYGSLGGYAGMTRGSWQTASRPRFRNSIVEAATVIQELEAWLPEYQRRNTSGLCSPQGAIGAVRGGWTYKPSFVTAATEIYLDLRCNPRTPPADVRAQFGEAIRGIQARHPEFDIEWEMFAAYPGSATSPESWIVQSAMRAWEEIEGRPHEPILGTSGQTDTSTIRNLGIPTVRLGQPAVRGDLPELEGHGRSGVCYVPDLAKVARGYIYALIDTCTRTREEVGLA